MDSESAGSSSETLVGVSLLALASALSGWGKLAEHLPLSVLTRLDTAWGRFFLYLFLFVATYGLSRWLFTCTSIDRSSGEVLELGAVYVTVSFWIQFVMTVTWLPSEISTLHDTHRMACCSNCWGHQVAGWINSATALPLALGKGIAILDRWRGKSCREETEVLPA